MLQKVVIVIKLLLVFNLSASSQMIDPPDKILGALKEGIKLGNDNSIIWLYKEPLSVNWNDVLTYQILEQNILYNDTFSSNKPYETLSIKKEIDSETLSYLRKTANHNYIKKWRKKHLVENYKILKRKVKLSPQNNSKGIKKYTKMSLPIFSKDEQLAIIQIDTLCGIECGEGQLFILKKCNTEWEILCYVTLWIS